MRIAIVHPDEDLRLMLAQLLSIDWPEADVDEFDPQAWLELAGGTRGCDVAFIDLGSKLPFPRPPTPACIGVCMAAPDDVARVRCAAVLDSRQIDRKSVAEAMKEALAARDRATHEALATSVELSDLDLTQPLAPLTEAEAADVRIKGYHVLKRIGRGGMATVYLADKQDTHETVAIKILDGELTEDDGQLKRFMQEFNLHSKIDSHHVAHIYEHGFTDDSVYIVMEYFPGGDMKPLLGKPLAPKRALGFLYQLAIALEDVHRQGVVHRDLKPQNIMFRADRSIALMDFGVSRALEWSWTLTMPGEVLGTPYYMSPEQGAATGVDARSDLYSLGAIFFEMLTGEKPYQANSLIALLYMHANDPVPTLPKEFAALQPIIDRTMAKDPKDRFASATELLDYIRERWARRTAAPTA
ncbi:MAG: serine/threonine protein kinase [Gammaproteobacteria bacterium]|nr:serine/threonine protein kinase [Gammaproteobacteria bacterium]